MCCDSELEWTPPSSRFRTAIPGANLHRSVSRYWSISETKVWDRVPNQESPVSGYGRVSKDCENPSSNLVNTCVSSGQVCDNDSPLNMNIFLHMKAVTKNKASQIRLKKSHDFGGNQIRSVGSIIQGSTT